MVIQKTIQQLFNEFIFECEYARKLKPETLRGYQESFKLFLKINPTLTLGDLNTQTVLSFFKTLEERRRIVGKGTIASGVKKSTIATYWSKLSRFFEWLANRRFILQNPFKEMAYPTPEYQDKKFLTKNEIEKILTAILRNPSKNILNLKRNLVLFYLLLFCGLRRRELISLQMRDIDLEKKVLTVRGETSKTNTTRYLPIHSQLLMYLKDYLKERRDYTTQYLLVSTTRDEKLGFAGLLYFVRSISYHSGVKFHPHQMRHTFAVNFLKTSKNIAKLQQLLGHKNITMTMHYLRCLPPHEMRGDIEQLNIDDFV